MHNAAAAQPAPRLSIEQAIDKNQRQEVQKNSKTKLGDLYAKIKKKPKDASDTKKRSSESSSSTDREHRSSSHLTSDEKDKHKKGHHSKSSGSTDREHRSSSHLTSDEKDKHKKGHHSKSSSSTDREHRSSSHLTKERRHKSKSHGDHSKSSSLASKKQENEPIYTEINDQQHTQQSIDNPDDEVFSQAMKKASNAPGAEGLRHRNTQPLPAPPKPPRNGTPSQSSDGTSTPSSKESSPPSYRSKSSGDSSPLRINPPSKLMIRLKYALRQKAFIIPITISIAFATVYTALLYFRNKEKFLSKITNLSNPEIYYSIIIASFLTVLSVGMLIYKYNKVDVEIPNAQGDEEIFEAMRLLNDDKCIRSITLKYSNNTNVTYLDKKKYKMLGFGNKRLKLTLENPLISFFGFASLVTIITYLSVKCLEIGYENLASSLENFSTTNTELMAVVIAVAITTALFTYSIYHSYRKTHVKGIKNLEQESFVDNIKDEMMTYNKEYIKEAESGNDDRETLSSQHSRGKVASLVIDQAIVEHYNSCSMVTIIPALAG